MLTFMGKPKPSTGIRLDPDQIEAIDKLAMAGRLSKTAVMRQLIDEAIKMRTGGQLAAEEARFHAGTNVDAPQGYTEIELPVVAFAPAGQGRDPESIETGETVRVNSKQARVAAKKGWQVVKVVGDSMTRPDGSGFVEGGFVVLNPNPGTNLRDGDVVFCLHNGDPMLKVIRFGLDKAGKMERIVLLSLNPRHRPISVFPTDEFKIVGTEEYYISGKQNFR